VQAVTPFDTTATISDVPVEGTECAGKGWCGDVVKGGSPTTWRKVAGSRRANPGARTRPG